MKLKRGYRIATEEVIGGGDDFGNGTILAFVLDSRFRKVYETDIEAINDYKQAIEANKKHYYKELFGEFTLIEVLEFVDD